MNEFEYFKGRDAYEVVFSVTGQVLAFNKVNNLKQTKSVEMSNRVSSLVK